MRVCVCVGVCFTSWIKCLLPRMRSSVLPTEWSLLRDVIYQSPCVPGRREAENLLPHPPSLCCSENSRHSK